MQQTLQIPVIRREATIRAREERPDGNIIEVVWTTGATVQRARWEGWDDRIEYDEELIVEPGAIRMERLNGGAPFLDSHQSWSLENVLGTVVPGSVRIEGGQGYAKIRLTSAADAEPAVSRILEGTVNRVSVGYLVHRYEITKQDGKRELWRAVDWEPYEISAVAMPADPDAVIRADETREQSRHPCVFTRAAPAAPAAHLRGTTMNPETMAADAQTEVRTTPAPAPVPSAATPELAARQAVDAERRRASDIRALAARHALPDSFTQPLIDGGVSIEEARSAVLDELAKRDPLQGRTFEPAPAKVRDTSGENAYRDAVAGALMHRADPGKHKLPEASRHFRGMTLMEMAREALERGGVSTRGMGKMELASAAFQQRGYHSTSDFPSILANVANKTLRMAYETTPRSFALWARRATIADFKPVQRTQLGGAPSLEKVLESGEIQYGTMGEAKETYALASYAKIISITRQTLINDDMDAFSRIPAAFGAAAADLESDIVYAILTSNPTMADSVTLFHADHGNLAGTAAAITEDSLAAAYLSMGAQAGLEGRLIRATPRFLIVPPGQRSLQARKQVTATTPSSAADVNAFAGRLEIVEEPRLIPASGAAPWFLATDPARIDTIEYAYLDGQEGVFTETRTGFEVDGLEVKARHDFAAAAIDHRGLFKNAGA